MAASAEQDLYDNADAKIRYEAYRCEFLRYEAYRWERLRKCKAYYTRLIHHITSLLQRSGVVVLLCVYNQKQTQ